MPETGAYATMLAIVATTALAALKPTSGAAQPFFQAEVEHVLPDGSRHTTTSDNLEAAIRAEAAKRTPPVDCSTLSVQFRGADESKVRFIVTL